MDIRQTVAAHLSEAYDAGRIDRATWRRRHDIATLAATELGEHVPDTAIGHSLVTKWAAEQLGWQFA